MAKAPNPVLPTTMTDGELRWHFCLFHGEAPITVATLSNESLWTRHKQEHAAPAIRYHSHEVRRLVDEYDTVKTGTSTTKEITMTVTQADKLRAQAAQLSDEALNDQLNNSDDDLWVDACEAEIEARAFDD